MNWIHPTALLFATWVVVFAQCWLTSFPAWIHAQPNLLPALVVYAAFNTELATTAAVALLAGLGTDALSAGPFGLGVVPLVALGVLLHRRRELILQDSTWAQVAMGLTGTFLVTLASIGLLFVLWPLLSDRGGVGVFQPERRLGLVALPPLRWSLLWQLAVSSLSGALATPVVFVVFRWVHSRLSYQPAPLPARRVDREVRRGRY